MNIGRRIYYDKSSGNILIDTGERSGDVFELSPEEEIQIYHSLAERRRDSFDFIKLNYGEYQEDFMTCSGYRVDLATSQLQFSYPDPNAPEEPTPYQQPLSDQVKELRNTIDSIMTDVLPSLFG